MLICPLDYRYGRKEMKALFSEESRLSAQLLVEAALARAHAEVGNIPAEAAEVISAKCRPEIVRLERVKAIEAEMKHDVMAMVTAIAEQCGDAGRYVHLGATSNDIVDTAAALGFKSALDIIERDLDGLIITMSALAFKHRRTVMMGRTHGQFAIPTTLGFKLAGYISELLRHRQRIMEIRPRVCVGKMSGAIGTGAGFGDRFFRIQDLVMKDLGLGQEEAATQLVCRDRYAELVFELGLISTSCERYATEVRNLQRSEIGEIAEAFDAKKQVGSSTMAQKKNPMLSENVSGLARVVRSYLAPQMECMVLWHERDLSNSSAERFILPHVAVLTDDILAKMNEVFANLTVNKQNMRRNIESANGFIMAEAVLLALANKGLGRQEAHELVRNVSMAAEAEGKGLKEALKANSTVKKLLSAKELEAVMEPDNYLGKAPEMVDRTIARAEAELGRKII
jgi:adenylosuccinate lyase